MFPLSSSVLFRIPNRGSNIDYDATNTNHLPKRTDASQYHKWRLTSESLSFKLFNLTSVDYRLPKA